MNDPAGVFALFLLSVMVGAGISLLAERFKRKDLHWPWTHKLAPVAVEHIICDYHGDHAEYLKQGIGSRETVILCRCECGKVKTRRIAGLWTLEQLKGNPQ
jgi:hypothetical protein